MCFGLKLINLYTFNFWKITFIGNARNESISIFIKKYNQNFPYVIRKIHIVPIKNGPRIKLKSLNIFVFIPPLTLHHLKGIAKKLSIKTSNDARIATGEYFIKDFLGRKKDEDQDIINNPILIIFGNTAKIPLFCY